MGSREMVPSRPNEADCHGDDRACLPNLQTDGLAATLGLGTPSGLGLPWVGVRQEYE